MNFTLFHFDSYFEVFAGLNLAYAAESYRHFLSENIYPLKRRDYTWLNNIITKTWAELNLLKPEDNAHRTFTKLLEKYNNKKSLIENSKITEPTFQIGLKTMFLVTGFFCLIVLLIAGFEQFFNNSNLSVFCLMFFYPILLYNIFVFFRSISRNKSKTIPLILPVFIIGILLLICHLCFVKITNYPNIDKNEVIKEVNIIICTFIAFSPYFFYSIRVIIYNQKCTWEQIILTLQMRVKIYHFRKLIRERSKIDKKIRNFPD